MGWFKEDDVQEMVWEENFTIIKQSIRGGGRIQYNHIRAMAKRMKFLGI